MSLLTEYGSVITGRKLLPYGSNLKAVKFLLKITVGREKAKLLLFVEVKTRRAGNKIRGFDAVGVEKQKLIERGANSWLKRLGTRNLPWRFDVIEVCVEEGKKPQVNQIKDAF